jgi:hypothetical protein
MLRDWSSDSEHDDSYGAYARDCSQNKQQETANRISTRRIRVAVHLVNSPSTTGFNKAAIFAHALTAPERKRRAGARPAGNTVNRSRNLQMTLLIFIARLANARFAFRPLRPSGRTSTPWGVVIKCTGGSSKQERGRINSRHL